MDVPPLKLTSNRPAPSPNPLVAPAVNFISKPTEYLDTYFMAVKGNLRQISFLHVVHHAIMPIIMYILITMVRQREREG